MIKFNFECDTEEELEAVRRFLIRGAQDENRDAPSSNALRQKRYRDSKKRNETVTDRNETVTRNVTDVTNVTKEERAEKEEDLPLSSPSSLSSSPCTPNNIPITPYNPPLPEEKGEKEESFVAAGAAKRGPLVQYGEFVYLTGGEYQKLVDKFGTLKATMMIANMNSYIGEDPKRQKTYKTRNHYLTLLNWQRMDEEKRQQTKPPAPVPKKKESWIEVAERVAKEMGQ